MKAQYNKKKKLIRLLLENDFFEEDFDFLNFLDSKFLKKDLLLSNSFKEKAKDYLEENNLRLAQFRFLELKKDIQKGKAKDFLTKDFEIANRPHADIAIRVRFLYTLDGEGIKPTKRELIVYEKGSKDFINLDTSTAQRFFIYLSIKADNKEDVINRLKEAFSKLEIPLLDAILSGKKIKVEPPKMDIFKLLVKKYKALQKKK